MAPPRPLTLLLACTALLGAPAAAAQQPEGAGGSTYAIEQAARGERIFGQWCVECHARGDMSSPDFQLKWNGRTALELYDRISVSMPENFPGAMAPTEYLEIVTYLLKLNGMPPGAVPLAGDTTALRKVRVSVPAAHHPATFHHLTNRGR